MSVIVRGFNSSNICITAVLRAVRVKRRILRDAYILQNSGMFLGPSSSQEEGHNPYRIREGRFLGVIEDQAR